MSIHPFHHRAETMPTSPAELAAFQIPSQPERGFFDEQAEQWATVHHLPYPDDRRTQQDDPYTKEQLFQAAHGSVAVKYAHDPVKYTITIPTDVVHPTAHLIVPGFGGFKRSSRGLRNAFSLHQSTAAISFEPPRIGNRLHDLFDSQRLHTDTIDAILNDLPNNVQLRDTANGNKLDLGSVVLDAHSMGGLSATRYAMAHPDNVKLLTYLEAVGLEDPRLMRFLPRLLPTILKDIGPSLRDGEFDEDGNNPRILLNALHYYARNPVRTIGEMGSCVSADIREQVVALGMLGVKRAMLYGGSDALIPAEPSVTSSGRLVDHCEVMREVGHAGPQTQATRVSARLAGISRKLITVSAA